MQTITDGKSFRVEISLIDKVGKKHIIMTEVSDFVECADIFVSVLFFKVIPDLNWIDISEDKWNGKDIFEMYFANEAMRSDGYYRSRCPKGLSFCADDRLGGSPVNLSRQEIINNCLNKGGNSGVSACGYMIQNNNWKVPKDYPVRI